jgi:dihydrofolate synthase/folylpolyglutamate synthase
VIRSVDEAATWLESLINLEKRPDPGPGRLSLDAIRRLVSRAGLPVADLAVVHVAGSKGKGSTALLAESILRAAGLRVGTFTSPHLECWTERFRIDGAAVPGDALASAVERLRPHVEALRADPEEPTPSFFDATTAAALLLFLDAGVERAVVEVGLGGRLDSTNVVRPTVSVVTTIELEHTDKLGSTLGAIAAEKAGILKPGVPVVAGALPDEARAVLAERADALSCPVAWLGREFRVDVLEERPDGQRLRLRDGALDLDADLPVLGRHQADNAAIALAAVRRGSALPDAALAAAARSGLATASLPGRVEVLRREPLVLVDAAHTEASARALAAVLARPPRRRTHLVLSLSAGKDMAGVLAALLPEVGEVTATRAEPSRSLAPGDVAAAVRAAAPALPVRVVPNPHLALRAAAAALAPGECLLATGSVYLAGIARRVLRHGDPAAGVEVTRRRGGSVVSER